MNDSASIDRGSAPQGSARLAIKRVYAAPAREDGFRVLVDRLWPRGLTKEGAKVDVWLKELGPSDGLRKWFAHAPQKWAAFQKRYALELGTKDDILNAIRERMARGRVTLLFGSKEERFNNAVALQAYLLRPRAPARAGSPARPAKGMTP